MAESYEEMFARTLPIKSAGYEYVLGDHPEDMPFIGKRYDEGLNGNRILLIRNSMEICSDAVVRIGIDNWYQRNSSALSQEDRNDLDLSTWYRSAHSSTRVLEDTLETVLGDRGLIENLAIICWNRIPISRNGEGKREYPNKKLLKSASDREKKVMAARKECNYLHFLNAVDILRPDLILCWGTNIVDLMVEQNVDVDRFYNLLDIPLPNGDVHKAGFIQMYSQSYALKGDSKSVVEHLDDKGGYWVENAPLMGLSGIEAFCVSMGYDRNHYRFYR